ncbi:hypothetical protein [Paraburkholderia sp. Ac-20347]|uniref:hypothetical protein n=1 Tax=Paraburkholderia sp. Ac-20347 TaxID=2703892 RepID=UPI00197E449E|nr:hypothetical protein [Paraburkholderia sp. Ac-20347]MBN3807694.1 hypothetical protein [Paraburkholderia sp. Ac-20347]
MSLNFEGKSVLVAGAARGLGEGIVRAFASRGANVYAADRLEDVRCTDDVIAWRVGIVWVAVDVPI